jgi:hypothetical protein
LTQSQPPITRATHTLPLDKLSPRDFERLCLWLVEREGYQRAEHLGLDCCQCFEYRHRPGTQHGVSPNADPLRATYRACRGIPSFPPSPCRCRQIIVKYPL